MLMPLSLRVSAPEDVLGVVSFSDGSFRGPAKPDDGLLFVCGVVGLFLRMGGSLEALCVFCLGA